MSVLTAMQFEQFISPFLDDFFGQLERADIWCRSESDGVCHGSTSWEAYAALNTHAGRWRVGPNVNRYANYTALSTGISYEYEAWLGRASHLCVRWTTPFSLNAFPRMNTGFT